MWFLYAEVLIFLAVAFALGCAVSSGVLRLVVRRTEADETQAGKRHPDAPGGWATQATSTGRADDLAHRRDLALAAGLGRRRRRPHRASVDQAGTDAAMGPATRRPDGGPSGSATAPAARAGRGPPHR